MNPGLHVTLVQLNPIVGDLSGNEEKILRAWENVPEHTDLVVFSELIVTGYPPEDLILKPFFMQEVQRTVGRILQSSQSFSAAALVSCPWEIKGKTYNVVHLVKNGEILNTQAKHILPNYSVFDEERIFEPGPLPSAIDLNGIKLGLLVCEDMWHPDVAVHLKDQGAEILVAVNASPFDTDKRNTRMEYSKKRVQETGLPLIYVNQVGGQDELVFDGASFIMESNGSIVFQAPDFEEGLYHIQVLKEKRWVIKPEHSYSVLEPLESIYTALILGLGDYIKKNNFPGVLIGLSGGIDSALSAAIAVDVLGPERVRCVMMPSKYTSQDSLDDAKEQAQIMGVALDTILIKAPVNAFNDLLANHVDPEDSPITFENIQSRTRGVILMALSNASGKMVLSTGNKSEMAVGYATLYGDMCGGFNVLKDIYKTQVYELAKWRNQNAPVRPSPLYATSAPKSGTIIPHRVITKAPTAELKDNQTDQDSLPPYEDLDVILYNAIEQEKSPEEIISMGYASEMVCKVLQMLDRSEYKRRQAPPGVKITSRAFGRDRRTPITNHFINTIEKARR